MQIRLLLAVSSTVCHLTMLIAAGPTRLSGRHTTRNMPSQTLPKHEAGEGEELVDPYLDYYQDVDPVEVLGE